jgi:hypothetical protein
MVRLRTKQTPSQTPLDPDAGRPCKQCCHVITPERGLGNAWSAPPRVGESSQRCKPPSHRPPALQTMKDAENGIATSDVKTIFAGTKDVNTMTRKLFDGASRPA